MALSWPVVVAVLFGALLHAAWNALIKAGNDKSLDTALIHVMGCAVAIPLLGVVGLPAPASWPWLAASLVIHIGYYIALAGAYRHGDLGLTYPIMRGLGPLLVAIVLGLSGGAIIDEPLSAATLLGVLGISAGVLLVGLAPMSAHGNHRRALRFALLNAAIIATYTIVDGIGVRASGNALQYVALLFLLDGIPYFLLVMHGRGAAGRPAAWAHMRGHWPIALLGTCASLGSYAIALWAMTRAPVAAVAALRETSVLFAAVLGTWLLKEPFGARRALGTLAIVGGVVALRLGRS
ncbi:MAG TPA: DMT family transporter [Burkholderiaceae bacterium]|nr:DMT family transporter [Burkholderiaceae bacterium]